MTTIQISVLISVTSRAGSMFRADGLRSALQFSTMNKIRMFTSWMGIKMIEGFFQLYAEDVLAQTREQFNDFRQADMIRMMGKSSSSPPGPTTPMTTLSGYTKGTITSESQTALNNDKKGTKRDVSAYLIFKNDLYYNTFKRSFLATIKVQGLYDVADPDYDPYDGDQYDQQLLEKPIFCIFCIGHLSPDRQRKRTRQEFEGDAMTIISMLHHYHTLSKVHLNCTDSWKCAIRQILSHFEEKHRLLDSLLPDCDKIPETARITFPQKAVHQNHDLMQIHFLDSIGDP